MHHEICGEHCAKMTQVVDVAGRPSHLLRPRFCMLAAEVNHSTHRALLQVSFSTWTRDNLHHYFGHAHQEWAQGHSLPSAAILIFRINFMSIAQIGGVQGLLMKKIDITFMEEEISTCFLVIALQSSLLL